MFATFNLYDLKLLIGTTDMESLAINIVTNRYIIYHMKHVFHSVRKLINVLVI